MDAINGGAGNDTISGLVGVSGTFGLGDTIVGGAGTDTLNLLVQSGGQAQLVSLSGVENVNARLLEAGPGSALALNAIDWSGVTTLSFDNSLDETAIRVSGITTSTTIAVKNEVDVNVDFRALTSGADVVSLTLTSAGSGGGTAASLTSAGVADINIDIDAAGLIDTVNVNLAAGTNYATLEAGADARTLNITGAGNAYLSTDDLYTSIDASGAAGNIDITLSGVSDVAVKGGAGNDTLRLGTTFTNSDSFDGGAGTNKIYATIGGFDRSLNTTNVQTAYITFNDDAGGTVKASGSTVSTYNIVAGSAGADGNIQNIGNGAVVNLAYDNLDDIALGFSAAAAATLNLGSASGSVAIDLLDVSGVASLTINAIGGTAGSAGTIAALSADTTLTSITIQSSGGEADLTLTTASAAKVQTVTILANGSGAITLTSGFDAGSALKTVTVVASGEAADVTMGAIGAAQTGLSAVSLTGNSGGDVTVGALTFGNGVTAASQATVTLSADSGSIVGTTAMDIGTTGDFDLTLDLQTRSSGTDQVGTVTLGAGTAGTGMNLIVSPGTIATGAVVLLDGVVIGGSGGQVSLGAANLAKDATYNLASAAIQATGVAAVSVSALTVTVGASANLLFGGATGGTAVASTGGAMGAISLTIGDNGSADIGRIVSSGVGAISLTIAGNGGASFGSISSTAGSVGNITVGVDATGSATFASIGASSVGAITVSGAGYVDIGAISAASVGTVDARQLVSGTFSIDLSGVTRAVEVNLGNNTNTVVTGKGNDVITLNAGSGQDNIKYNTSVGVDSIVNFGAGSTAGDVIQLNAGTAGADTTVGGTGGLRNGDGVAVATGTVAVDFSALTTATGTTLDTADNMVVLGTAFASTAAMALWLQTGVAFTTALAGSGSIAVVWTDGASSSYISLVNFDMASTATGVTLTTGTVSVTTLAVLSGVTPGALVAANFDFV